MASARPAKWSAAPVGVLVVMALMISACTSATPTAPVSSSNSAVSHSPSASAIPDRALVIAGEPSQVVAYYWPHGLTADVYKRESSCPGRRVGRDGLGLAARWRYQDGVVRLSAVQVSFNETSGSLALPFLTLTIRSGKSTHNWATSVVMGNQIVGYHSTGWVSLGYKSKATTGTMPPALSLRIWVESTITAKINCVATTGFFLLANATQGESAGSW